MSKYKVDCETFRSTQSRPATEVGSKIFINPKYTLVNATISNTSIHINPHFSNAYINPLFKYAHINPHFKPSNESVHNVHINPKLFSSLLDKNTNHTLKTKEPQKGQTEINSSSLSNPSQYSYISNRKLVKKSANEKTQVKTNISARPVFKKSRNKLVRLPIQNANKPMQKFIKTKISTIQKMANTPLSPKILLPNKYRSIHSNIIHKIKSTDMCAQYKLDRRVIKSTNNKHLHNTRYAIISSRNSGKFKSVNTRYKIIKLGAPNKKEPSGLPKISNKGILTIMDSQYVMKKQGRTLKKIGIDNISTSAGKDNSKLNKTNYVTGRRQNLKLNNVPCLVYRKFGLCKRHELGRCFKVHDKKQIDICKEYLGGKCSADKCAMSHDVSAAKMPVCLHYLAGACGRDNCPYPHVKHSLDVPVCKQFLRGYCVKAEKCDKRHVFICPDFDKNGSCPRHKCPYPHGIAKSKTRVKSTTKCKSKQIQKEISVKGCDENVRYYDEAKNNCNTNEKSADTIYPDKNELTTDVSIDKNVKTNKRPALGTLPSYIPL